MLTWAGRSPTALSSSSRTTNRLAKPAVSSALAEKERLTCPFSKSTASSSKSDRRQTRYESRAKLMSGWRAECGRRGSREAFLKSGRGWSRSSISERERVLICADTDAVHQSRGGKAQRCTTASGWSTQTCRPDNGSIFIFSYSKNNMPTSLRPSFESKAGVG